MTELKDHDRKFFIEFCPHCRCNSEVCVSDDIDFYFHWVGDCYLIDVVLFVPEASVLPVLYREVYVLSRG